MRLDGVRVGELIARVRELGGLERLHHGQPMSLVGNGRAGDLHSDRLWLGLSASTSVGEDRRCVSVDVRRVRRSTEPKTDVGKFQWRVRHWLSVFIINDLGVCFGFVGAARWVKPGSSIKIKTHLPLRPPGRVRLA